VSCSPTGYSGIIAASMMDEPVPQNRPDYLFRPIPGDRGSHGRFDDKSRARSVQLWASTHRRGLLAGAYVAAGALGGLRRRS
jgi:hypothetical protein